MPPICVPPATLQSFLAGELSPIHEEQVTAHLESCATCQQLADELSGDEATRPARPRSVQNAEVGGESLAEISSRLYALARLNDYREGEATSPIDNYSTLAAHPAASAASMGTGPARLGKFEIVRQVGAGGFAIVYLARDTELGRDVALKLARGNDLSDPGLRERFFREAKALARLKHPHIVPVFEAGEHEGTCYLAVEFCTGPNLDQWLHNEAVQPKLAAKITRDLARAVEHAHACGILHRDIKPSNVLLDGTVAGGDFPFTPRLTDFGLARLSEEQHTGATLSGMVMGTPQYMSPEQAAGHVERIGPPTDVYSLGAVLYELLTGVPPIQGTSPVDTLRRVLIDEPVPPQVHRAGLPEDLCAIAMKCLEKSVARRYATAAELADDLDRFLHGRPTVARPLGFGQRAWRHLKSNRTSAALGVLTVTVLALVGGLYFYEQSLNRIQGEMAKAIEMTSLLEQRVQSSDEQIEQLAYAEDMSIAADAALQGDLSQATALLRRQQPMPGKPDLRGYEWHYLWALASHESFAAVDAGTEVYQLALSPDGVQLAAAGKDGVVRLYDSGNLKFREKIVAGQGEINGVDFNWNGQRLATAGDDGTVKVWQLADHKLRATLPAVPSHAYGVCFQDAGASVLAFGREGVLRSWQVDTGTSIAEMAGHTDFIEALAISPDGSKFATASSDRTAIIWNSATRQPLHQLVGHRLRLSCVAFSPDGQRLATGSLDNRLIVWDVSTGKPLCEATHFDAVQCASFTRDGQRLIAGDRAGTIRIWQIDADDDGKFKMFVQTVEDTWQAHQGRVWSLLVLPTGDRFLSAGQDGQIRGWIRGDRQRLERTIASPDPSGFIDFDFAADGTIYACGKQSLTVWDSSSRSLQHRVPSPLAPFRSLAILENAGLVAVGNEAGQIALWDRASRQWRQPISLGYEGYVNELVYSPAAGLLAALCHQRDSLQLVDPRTGRVVNQVQVPSHNFAAFSPDGKTLVIDTLNQLAIYTVPDLVRKHLVPAHASTINDLDFSVDGQLIASVSNDRTLKLWTPEGKRVTVLRNHRRPVRQVAFTPDGRSLISGDEGGGIRIAQVATHGELLDLPNSSRGALILKISPSSRLLGVLNPRGSIDIIGPAERAAD
jgi:WD40 repeat protein/serine/threonine protein kinase